MSDRYTEERHISASPEAVFDYVADVANIPEWADAVVEVTAHGDPGEGQRIESLSSMMGLKIRGEQVVQAHERPNTFRYGGDDPFPSSFEWSLEPDGVGTRATLIAEVTPKGLPGGGLVVGRFIKKQIKGMADGVAAKFS